MTQPNVEWPNLNAPYDPEKPMVVDAAKVEKSQPQKFEGEPSEENVTNFPEDDDPESLVGDEIKDDA